MLPNIDYRLATRFIDMWGRTWRRNGQTKLWKRSPERFRIPVKHGLYVYDAITELNMGNVEVMS